MSLNPHDVVQFDTHHGHVWTVAVYDRDLPAGAVIVQPKPFLTYTQDEYEHALAQYGQVEFGFHMVTKAWGEDEAGRSPDQLNVRDIDADHVYDGHAGGWSDEGFFAYTYPTLMHRVVQTDDPGLAELVANGDRAGGGDATLDDVLVSS